MVFFVYFKNWETGLNNWMQEPQKTPNCPCNPEKKAEDITHPDFKLYHKVIGTKHYSTGMKTDIEINEIEYK